MKNKQLILTMLMIITIILTAGIACANDEADTQSLEIEQKSQIIHEKTVKQEEEIVNVNSYEELYDTITTANANNQNKTINLNDGNYDITEDIEIKGDRKAITITINGNNNIINGNNQNSFISIQKSNTLIVNNLTIINTKSDRANAFYNLGNCIMDNITIKDTYSKYNNSSSGGAIYNSGSMNITKCKFINNKLDSNTFGGAVIYNSKNINVTDSIFENNTSRDASAIYFLNSKNAIIQNCLFKNNIANVSTIYNLNSNITIINSRFESNTGEYPIFYLLDKGCVNLSDSQITKHSSANGLTYNNGELIIDNVKMFNNNVSRLLFDNNNRLIISNSNIYENNGSILSNNHDAFIINTNVTSNSAVDSLTENLAENAMITIENSTFTNNTAKHICSENIATTIIKDTSYYNNTCEELFEGTTEHIKASNNTYIGNKLFSQIVCNDYHSFNYDEDILIYGIIKTKDVYNTTISTGTLSTYWNGSISSSEINSNAFIANITEIINNSSNPEMVFEAFPDYKNCNKTITVEILRPEYDISIISDEKVDYDTPFNYGIRVKNTGRGNGSNITLNIVIPENLVYVSSDNPDYKNDTWTIGTLKSNETKTLTLRVKCISSSDIKLNATVNDPNTNENISYSKTIKVNAPIINMNISDNHDNLTITDKLKLNMSIVNEGNGKSGNLTVTINIDGIKTYDNTFNPIRSNECLNISYESLINKTGKYNVTITVTDEIFNLSTNKSFELNIKKPGLIVDNSNAHVNDSINLTAHIINLKSLDNSTIVFKVNNITITGYQIITNGSDICLENFSVPSYWKKRNYTLEVKLFKKGFESVLMNTSLINILKLNVYSVVYNITGFPKDKINLTAIIIDERNQRVDVGIARFKINGITIRQTIHVKNGVVLLKDYVIPENFRGPKYNLSLVYGENNLYHSNRNTSVITLEKEESDIDITNTTFIKREDFTVYARIYRKSNNDCAYGGKAIVKINRKTVSPVLDVSGGEISFTIPNIPTSHIDCIIVCYSGNEILLPSRKVVGINKFNWK